MSDKKVYQKTAVEHAKKNANKPIDELMADLLGNLQSFDKNYIT